jgi:hypothetical protein
MCQNIEELQEGYSISRRREGNNIGYGGWNRVVIRREACGDANVV